MSLHSLLVTLRCRSCNVLNMHAMGKRVTQILMNARAVVGVNEVNCLGMLGFGMLGQILIGCHIMPLRSCTGPSVQQFKRVHKCEPVGAHACSCTMCVL